MVGAGRRTQFVFVVSTWLEECWIFHRDIFGSIYSSELRHDMFILTSSATCSTYLWYHAFFPDCFLRPRPPCQHDNDTTPTAKIWRDLTRVKTTGPSSPSQINGMLQKYIVILIILQQTTVPLPFRNGTNTNFPSLTKFRLGIIPMLLHVINWVINQIVYFKRNAVMNEFTSLCKSSSWNPPHVSFILLHTSSKYPSDFQGILTIYPLRVGLVLSAHCRPVHPLIFGAQIFVGGSSTILVHGHAAS
jgi:hypothetical protein